MGETANRAYIRVTYEALKKLLGLPEGTIIRCVENDMNDVLYNHEVRVLVEHPDLPSILPQGESPTCSPIVEYVNGKVVFRGWE